MTRRKPSTDRYARCRVFRRLKCILRVYITGSLRHDDQAPHEPHCADDGSGKVLPGYCIVLYCIVLYCSTMCGYNAIIIPQTCTFLYLSLTLLMSCRLMLLLPFCFQFLCFFFHLLHVFCFSFALCMLSSVHFHRCNFYLRLR